MDSQKMPLGDINQNSQINLSELRSKIEDYFNNYVNKDIIDSNYDIKVEPGKDPYSYNVKIYEKIPYIKMEVIIHD